MIKKKNKKPWSTSVTFITQELVSDLDRKTMDERWSVIRLYTHWTATLEVRYCRTWLWTKVLWRNGQGRFIVEMSGERSRRWKWREMEAADEECWSVVQRVLPAVDGSQSQWGMEGDPAVTLKQQVEAIIRTGTGDWMRPHTLISLGPSGPLLRAYVCVCVCVCVGVYLKREAAVVPYLQSPSPPPFLSFPHGTSLLPKVLVASSGEGWVVPASGSSLLMAFQLPFNHLQYRRLFCSGFIFHLTAFSMMCLRCGGSQQADKTQCFICSKRKIRHCQLITNFCLIQTYL